MNRYFIRLPYNYIQYGDLTGYVYAESEEEAEELLKDNINIHNSEYEDGDGDSTNYLYDLAEIELEEEDIEDIPVSVPAQRTVQTGQHKFPSYYLSDINLI